MGARVLATILPALAAGVLLGCGNEQDAALTLVAATSLKTAVETVIADFKRANPGIQVRATFAASDQIQRQLEGGLDADVVVTASGTSMRPLAEADIVEDPEPFAGNALTIAVSKKSAVPIGTAHDLALKQRLSLGQSELPVGQYADEVVAELGKRFKNGFVSKVAGNVVNRASNAAEVITPVALGGVDSSISYVTDARANASRVRTVAIPGWAQPTIAYWIARAAGASDAAGDFIDFIKSPDGQGVLRAAGFLAVPAAAGEKP